MPFLAAWGAYKVLEHEIFSFRGRVTIKSAVLSCSTTVELSSTGWKRELRIVSPSIKLSGARAAVGSRYGCRRQVERQRRTETGWV